MNMKPTKVPRFNYIKLRMLFCISYTHIYMLQILERSYNAAVFKLSRRVFTAVCVGRVKAMYNPQDCVAAWGDMNCNWLTSHSAGFQGGCRKSSTRLLKHWNEEKGYHKQLLGCDCKTESGSKLLFFLHSDV